MIPSRPFILRPVATSLFMAAILLAGLIAFRFLPLSALPQVDYPTIEVQTFYPGASPEVVTSAITSPLERQLGQMPGLTQMSSRSSSGASVITLQFDLSLALDVAEQQVQAAINAANNLLPSDLPAPPVYAKVNPADAPVLTLAVTSKTLALSQVQDIADTRLAQKISQLPGVGMVRLAGGNRPAMRITVNPRALAAYGIGIDSLRTTVANANINAPKGSFDGPARATTINANDQLSSVEGYEAIVVAHKNGAAVRLKDVASVTNGVENTQLGAWASFHDEANPTINILKPAIVLNVQRQPGANVISVVDNIKKLLPGLKSGLPAAVDVDILSDRTTTIRASVEDVGMELTFSVALVVAVMFVFLRNLPATIIPSLSVPLSLIGTLAVMYLAGFSLNNLSLMALTIATGFVVDDAIVMIENIARYIEKGEKPMDAALKGAGEIGFTIVSLTISLIAVLIPLLFMGDVVGRLFREFAITLSVTILISAVVSLTLVPMMCARLLRHHKPEEEGAFLRKTQAWFDAAIAAYGRGLTVVLRHETLTLLIAVATLALTVALYTLMPKGFFPTQDTGIVQATTRAEASTSYTAMAERQRALAEALLKDPDVGSLTSFIGVDGTNATLNSGRLQIALKPLSERTASAHDILARLDERAAQVTGISLSLQPVQDLTIDTTAGAAQYQFILESADKAELARWTPKLVDKLRADAALRDVSDNLQAATEAAYIRVDRDSAGRMGLSLAAIDNALYDAFGQRIVSTVFTQSNQYRVILSAEPTFDTLQALHVASAAGEQVPLSAVATIETRQMAAQINHLGQFPSAQIFFNTACGVSLGAAVDTIEGAAQSIGLPPGVMIKMQGSALAFQGSMSNQLLLILAAIITVYIVLGILYESTIHPVTILSTLPSAGVGALIALMLAGHDLDIIAVIGIVLLIGIVKKNAIMMIDFALDAEREQGMAARDAIYQACLLRFRPIMMTTMAALLGALPLMLGSGMGSELRRPLGVAIVGGLIVSQVLTLFTTPVIYLAFDKVARRGRKAA